MSDRGDGYGGGGAGWVWAPFVGLSLVAVLAAILSGRADGRPGGPVGQQERPSQHAGEEARASGGEAMPGGAKLGYPALGEDAPVGMLEYSDYQ